MHPSRRPNPNPKQETRGSLLRASEELEAPLLGEAVQRLWPTASSQGGGERAIENERLVRDAVTAQGHRT